MSSSHARFSLLLIPLLFLTLSPLALQAQDSVDKTTSVTDCLQKGVEPGGLYIVGADSNFWELAGKVDSAHVGHTVTVKGHVLHRTAAEEAKYADSEKQEANGKTVADFQVTSLKMVGDSCK